MKNQMLTALVLASVVSFGGATSATALMPSNAARLAVSVSAESDVQQIRHRHHRRHFGHRHHRHWGHRHHRRWGHRRHSYGYYGFVPRIYFGGGYRFGHHHHHHHH